MDARGVARRARALVREHGLWASGVLTALVFAAMVLFADVGRVRAAFAAFDPWAFAAVIGLATVGYGVRFLKWEFYLRELDESPGLKTSALVFLCGLMMVVTPGKAGEVWKAWFLRDRAGTPVARTVSVVGAERVTDLLALGLFAATGLAVYSRSSTVLLGVGVAFALGLGLLQWRSASLRLLAAVESIPAVGRYAAEIREFYESAYALFRPRPLAVSTALSLLAWGLEGVAFLVALEGFGADATLLVGLFVFGLGSVVGAVSMLPGGLAAAEASMVGLLLTFGYARPVAVGATIVVRVGTLWYAALLGLGVFSLYKLAIARRVDSSVPDAP